MNIEQLRALYESRQTQAARAPRRTRGSQRAIDEAGDDAASTSSAPRSTRPRPRSTTPPTSSSAARANLADGERRQKALDDNPETARRARPDVRSLAEPAVYSEPSEHSFFRDAYRFRTHRAIRRAGAARAARQAEPRADAREGRHAPRRRHRRVAGLTIPQYLTTSSRRSRVQARRCSRPDREQEAAARRGHGEHRTLITTGSPSRRRRRRTTPCRRRHGRHAAHINIRTYAGQQDVSRQALERSAASTRRCTATCRRLLHEARLGDHQRGRHERQAPRDPLDVGHRRRHLHRRVADGAGALPEVRRRDPQINGGVFAPATTILAHSRRWGWGTAALDTATPPAVRPVGERPVQRARRRRGAGYGAGRRSAARACR
jgi:hypothetical protein